MNVSNDIHQLSYSIYRSVPLIRPPILYTTSRLKWGGGGLYSRMQLVSTISPPPLAQKRFYASAMYAIRTLPKLMFAFHYQLTTATTFRIESTVRGHHVYKAAWSPYIGEELPVQHEVNNIHDDFAVAVLKNGNTVGHVPREISRVCWYFLHKSGSEMTVASSMVTEDVLKLMGKDSWFRACTSSEGNKNTLTD